MSYLEEAKHMLTDKEMVRSVPIEKRIERALLSIIDHLENVK